MAIAAGNERWNIDEEFVIPTHPTWHRIVSSNHTTLTDCCSPLCYASRSVQAEAFKQKRSSRSVQAEAFKQDSTAGGRFPLCKFATCYSRSA
jgi:hypothetical protein